MLRNRKPFRVDLIVFTVCCLLASWYAGFLYGESTVKCIAPAQAKKLSVHDMTKVQQKRMAKYLAARSY